MSVIGGKADLIRWKADITSRRLSGVTARAGIRSDQWRRRRYGHPCLTEKKFGIGSSDRHPSLISTGCKRLPPNVDRASLSGTRRFIPPRGRTECPRQSPGRRAAGTRDVCACASAPPGMPPCFEIGLTATLTAKPATQNGPEGLRDHNGQKTSDVSAGRSRHGRRCAEYRKFRSEPAGGPHASGHVRPWAKAARSPPIRRQTNQIA